LTALSLIKKQPCFEFAMLYWLTFGEAHLKEEIAKRSVLDFSDLPLQKDFVEFLNNEVRQG